MTKIIVTIIVVMASSVVGVVGSIANVLNGDFEAGLGAWQTSAIDAVIPPTPLSPLIEVTSAGGNSFAMLETGSFATGPFISTLEQTFLVPSNDPRLRFDFSVSTAPDPTGTGSSSFLDALAVSVSDGVDVFDLLLVDATGPVIDPFGTAVDPVSLGPPANPFFASGFEGSLASLAGRTVTIFFDVINEDDRATLTALVDNVSVSSSSVAVPSAPTLLTLVLGVMGLGGCTRYRRNAGTAGHLPTVAGHTSGRARTWCGSPSIIPGARSSPS